MTTLGATQQRLADLHLYLYCRSFHPELFEIYASEQLSTAAYEADVWIIGCSHLVSFRAGRTVLTELTAQDDRFLGKRWLLNRWRLRGERCCHQTVEPARARAVQPRQGRPADGPGRVNYIASFQVEELSAQLYRQAYLDLAGEGKRRGLLAEFPQWRHKASRGLTPFSYVHAEPCARELRVHAFHGFPDGCALVKTQSIFEIR